MTDVFSNLAAQSLNSRVGIQPLILPLFAPAPQLVSDASLLAPNDQPAVAAETRSVILSESEESVLVTTAGSMLSSEIEPPSQEATSPEKRTILPNLIPPDLPQHTISILSLRHLLHPHLTHDNIESVSPTSQSSAPVSPTDEPSSEDTSSLALPIASLPDNPVGASAERSGARINPSRPTPMYRPPSEAPFNPLVPQPIQSQELAPPHSEATGIPPSFKRHDDQKQIEENLPSATPTKREPLNALPVGTETSLAVGAPLAGILSIPSRPAPIDRPPLIAPLPAQPSSPQPPIPSEQIANPDVLPNQQSSSLVHPSMQPTITPPRTGPLIVPIPNASAPMPVQQTAVDGQDRQTGRDQDSPLYTGLATQPVYGRGDPLRSPWSLQESLATPNPTGTTQPPVLSPTVLPQPVIPPTPHVSQETPDTPRRGLSGAKRSAYQSFAPTADVSAPPGQDSPQVSPKQETHVPKEEAESPPIRITIGRVVVRATPAAQPTPTHKRVLRPAQSLSEYLKQRERGSR